MRALALACLALAGCAGPPEVTALLEPGARSRAELQTRRFEGVRPAEMLPAAVATLQDFGFQVVKSDTAVGLIVAQRGYKRSLGEYHSEFWQGYWQIMRNSVTLQWHSPGRDPARMFGPAGVSAAVSIEPASSGSEVRVSLHRFATKLPGEPTVAWAEELAEPELYAKFFDLLTQALAREARQK